MRRHWLAHLSSSAAKRPAVIRPHPANANANAGRCTLARTPELQPSLQAQSSNETYGPWPRTAPAGPDLGHPEVGGPQRRPVTSHPSHKLLRWQAARTWARLIREAEALWHVDVRAVRRLAARELGQLIVEVPPQDRQRVNRWLISFGVSTRLE